MFYTHEDVELAKRQIRQAEMLIFNHQRIIDRLREYRQPTALAEKLMTKMQTGLELRQKHLGGLLSQMHGQDPVALETFA